MCIRDRCKTLMLSIFHYFPSKVFRIILVTLSYFETTPSIEFKVANTDRRNQDVCNTKCKERLHIQINIVVLWLLKNTRRSRSLPLKLCSAVVDNGKH